MPLSMFGWVTPVTHHLQCRLELEANMDQIRFLPALLHFRPDDSKGRLILMVCEGEPCTLLLRTAFVNYVTTSQGAYGIKITSEYCNTCPILRVHAVGHF